MLRRTKLFSVLIMSWFFSTTPTLADEQLLDGLRPFICNGEEVILFENDDGWAIMSELEYEVFEVRNGWQIGDQGKGFIAYLKEYEQDEWKFEVLSDGGYEELNCIDMTDSVSDVVTAIKPRLDEAIVATQEALADVTGHLRIADQKISRLQQENLKAKETIERLETALASMKEKIPTSDSYSLAIQRVDRLCIWMKTYRHLDVLDKTFPFGDAQYRLCD